MSHYTSEGNRCSSRVDGLEPPDHWSFQYQPPDRTVNMASSNSPMASNSSTSHHSTTLLPVVVPLPPSPPSQEPQHGEELPDRVSEASDDTSATSSALHLSLGILQPHCWHRALPTALQMIPFPLRFHSESMPLKISLKHHNVLLQLHLIRNHQVT